MGKPSTRRKRPPKSKCQKEDNTKPVFTFQQMERIVDLIDRQASLLANRYLLANDYVYAKNESPYSTYFIYKPDATYHFTLHAMYPAVDNYLNHNISTYTDGTVGVYRSLIGGFRYRIYLDQTMYAKYDHNTLTMTFYNIPHATVVDMYNLGYISTTGTADFYTSSPVDYHREEAVDPTLG